MATAQSYLKRYGVTGKSDQINGILGGGTGGQALGHLQLLRLCMEDEVYDSATCRTISGDILVTSRNIRVKNIEISNTAALHATTLVLHLVVKYEHLPTLV